jgi:hypothetical protein
LGYFLQPLRIIVKNPFAPRTENTTKKVWSIPFIQIGSHKALAQVNNTPHQYGRMHERA